MVFIHAGSISCGRHHGLSEAYSAVVGWNSRVSENPKAVSLELFHGSA
jgi:hypothetical protein